MADDKNMAFNAKVKSVVFDTAKPRSDFTVRMPVDLLAKLGEEAKRTFRTRSSIVFEALQAHFDKQEGEGR